MSSAEYSTCITNFFSLNHLHGVTEEIYSVEENNATKQLGRLFTVTQWERWEGKHLLSNGGETVDQLCYMEAAKKVADA